MKKINYIIDGEEKNQILEMHSKMRKSVISEQVTPDLKQQLTKVLADGCVRNGEIVSMGSKTPILQLAIKQESTKTPGKFRYFFADNRVGMFDESGKFQFSPSKWTCKGVQQAAAQQTATDNTSKIQSLKKQNWKTRDELVGVDLNTIDKVYDKVTIGNVVLYRPKGQSTDLSLNTSTAEFNTEQNAFVETYKKIGYQLNPDRVERANMVAVTDKELGAPPDLFPNGLTMYYNPATQSTMKGRDGSVLGGILDNQSIDRNVCRKNIKDYFNSFKQRSSIVVNQADLLKVKRIVQACKDQHYNKWGIGGEGKKIDNYLDILSGDREGGPISSSKWRIQ